MLWKGRRGSQNVEDRRSISGKKLTIGGGIGAVAIFLIISLLGGDPAQVFNMIQQNQESSESQIVENNEEKDMATFVSVVLADTEDVWEEIFKKQNKTYRKPKLVLFRDNVQSACGFASATSGPFYCSGDEKIYIDLSFCDILKEKFGAYGDFAIAYVIAHEVGHHVQNLLGILSDINEQKKQLPDNKANALTVQLELQADFLAGIWAHYADKMLKTLEAGDINEAINAAGAVGDDAIQMKMQGKITPDNFTHGTSKQRMEWFEKGFKTGKMEI